MMISSEDEPGRSGTEELNTAEVDDPGLTGESAVLLVIVLAGEMPVPEEKLPVPEKLLTIPECVLYVFVARGIEPETVAGPEVP